MLDVVHEPAPQGCVLRVAGEIDAFSAARVMTEVEKCIAASPSRVRLDLADVAFVDAEGARTLLRAREHILGSGARFEMRMSPPVARIARLMDLNLESTTP
jgi:anti-anti-sigma factor